MSDSFATPWTVAHQTSLSMGFPRLEYWSELPFPSPGDLPNPGIEPMSLHWQMNSLPLSHLGSPAGAVGVAQSAASARGILQITIDSSCKDFMGLCQTLYCLHVINDILSEKEWTSLSLDP